MDEPRPLRNPAKRPLRPLLRPLPLLGASGPSGPPAPPGPDLRSGPELENFRYDDPTPDLRHDEGKRLDGAVGPDFRALACEAGGARRCRRNAPPRASLAPASAPPKAATAPGDRDARPRATSPRGSRAGSRSRPLVRALRGGGAPASRRAVADAVGGRRAPVEACDWPREPGPRAWTLRRGLRRAGGRRRRRARRRARDATPADYVAAVDRPRTRRRALRHSS